MKIYRFNSNVLGRAGSVKKSVVIVAPNLTDSKLESIKERFPNSLLIAEVNQGTPAREGYFNVLRIKASELETYDYDLKGCRAILVEEADVMFYAELTEYRENIANNAGLPPERIRFCCNFLSEQGCGNLSCYSAGALRDYASEMGMLGILPTSKKEVLQGNSLCLCVKSDK